MDVTEKRQKCRYNEECSEDCKGCIRQAGISRLLKFSGLPEYQWKREHMQLYMPKDSKDRKVYEMLKDIQDNIVEFVNGGRQLYICSSRVGNGKTTWAIKLLLAYLDEKSYWLADKPRGMFVNVCDYLYKSKDFTNPMQQGYRENMKDCDLLVLDDIAIAGLTDFDYINFYGILEHRAVAHKSTIFTGNCTDPEIMEDILGQRLTSRIWNKSLLIEFLDSDRRCDEYSKKKVGD